MHSPAALAVPDIPAAPNIPAAPDVPAVGETRYGISMISMVWVNNQGSLVYPHVAEGIKLVVSESTFYGGTRGGTKVGKLGRCCAHTSPALLGRLGRCCALTSPTPLGSSITVLCVFKHT